MIEEITSPPFLDDTAQEMVTKLQAIANNIKNNAGQVSYSNTTSQLQATKVQTAIDEVKGITDTISSNLATKADSSELANYYTKTQADTLLGNKQAKGDYVSCGRTTWGTSTNMTPTGIQFLVIANAIFYVVWFGGTNDVSVRNVGENTSASGTGSVTLGSATFSRSGKKLTVTFPTNNAISIFAF